ncbi:hypothetical protein [Microbacterium sp. 179-I 3D4 NHS]|uniref:hypothetical protein n=1 Tax=Microbacterium sp. 179-I 3D4 NHS TaxID=3142381 RepID=UPI0039A0F386
MGKDVYYVSFRESAVVTEAVLARSKAEAIRLVKDGEGKRVSFEIDETRFPTNFEAERESETDAG